jgi:hypothetical protein
MKITKVATFVLHVPVTRAEIEDSSHLVTRWGLCGSNAHTEIGLCGEQLCTRDDFGKFILARAVPLVYRPDAAPGTL